MDDSLLVRVLDGLTDLHKKLEPSFDVDSGPIAILGDGHPLDVLHHEERTSLVGHASVKHFGDVGMIHDSQCLTLELEARKNVPAVHSQLDELERHAPSNRLNLFGNPNGSHSSFADFFQQTVAAANDCAGTRGCWPNRGRLPFPRELESPDFGQFARFIMQPQERLDTGAQLRIVSAFGV